VEVEVVVEVEVRPTEDEEKVRKAIENLFTGKPVFTGSRVRLECKNLECLDKLHTRLRQQRILDTARSIMRKSVYGDYIEFMLHKQAAYAGKVSFVTDPSESPLGPIRVSIRYPDPGEVIDWLAPRTKHGRPLWNRDMPQA
jgi:predicted RNA binding protein with dsRBD fold (UPF0201 family)